MSVTDITPTQLVTNTRSADITDSDGTAAGTPADGWSITLGSQGTVEKLLLKFAADGSGDTVTVLAGDNPPALTAGKGNLSVVLAASDVRYVVLEAGRFLQDDNTVKATCTDAGTTVKAFLMPVAIGGGSGIA